MRYEELIVALRKAGIPIKATLRVLYTLPPKKEPQILVRWGKDSKGEASLLCYVGLEYGLAEATAVPLEEVAPAHVTAYAAAWKAEYGKKENPA